MRIAATGTRHLISCGRFASYGYVHFREDFCQHLSQLRERGFLETLRKSGLAGMRYMSAAPEGKSDLDDLAAWLRQLPKPAAVLVGYDRRAAEVVDCCQRNGIRIPDEVCVLGIDNDEIICQQTRPRLSSVATDNASEGRIAAQQILALLRAKAPDRERKTVYGPTAARIVERETTRVLAPGLQLVKRAQAYIAENAGRAVSVKDVVTHLGVSRRLAYRRFGEFARQPIHRAILEARVAWVKQRLLSSRQTIEDVSLEAGFANPNNLKIIFRRLTGMTMREWRARNARPAPCK